MRQSQRRKGLRTLVLRKAAFFGMCVVCGGWLAAAREQEEASMATAISLAANQQCFTSAADATTALIAALQTDDTKALLRILGPGGEKLVVTGDPIAAKAARERFLALYAQRHELQTQPDGSVDIIAGNYDWPMPIPIVQVGGKWQFDATIGAQVIVEREIGRNELKTIQTLLSAADAQEDFFDRMKRTEGVGFYAQRLYSTPGQHNGLYWDAAQGEEESPLGPLVEQAEDEGYPGATQKDGVQTPYHGYYFRLLTAQGPDAPEGAESYIHNGKMTTGFAYVAWPSIYARSGIMSFIVNQDGNVFQKDLGPDTARGVAAMKLFNPDLSWALVHLDN